MTSKNAPDIVAASEWYRANHDTVAQYPGEWVAITENGIAAHGVVLKEVMAESKKKGLTHPLLHKVPPEGILALWWSAYA